MDKKIYWLNRSEVTKIAIHNSCMLLSFSFSYELYWSEISRNLFSFEASFLQNIRLAKYKYGSKSTELFAKIYLTAFIDNTKKSRSNYYIILV